MADEILTYDWNAEIKRKEKYLHKTAGDMVQCKWHFAHSLDYRFYSALLYRRVVSLLARTHRVSSALLLGATFVDAMRIVDVLRAIFSELPWLDLWRALVVI